MKCGRGGRVFEAYLANSHRSGSTVAGVVGNIRGAVEEPTEREKQERSNAEARRTGQNQHASKTEVRQTD